MKRLHQTAWLFIFCMLTACSYLGVQAPQTFNERLLAGYKTTEVIANTAIALRASGQLSDSDRDNVVATNRTAIAGLDLAKQINATNPQGANDKLTTTIALLTALQAYLATKGPQ